MIAVAIGYIVVPNRKKRSGISIEAPAVSWSIRSNGTLGAILTIVSLVSMIAFLSAIGLTAALSTRETLDNAASDLVGSGFLVTMPRVLTFLPVIYGALLTKFSTDKKLGIALLLVNVPIFLIVNFPLALPRSQVFGIFLIFLLLLLNFKIFWALFQRFEVFFSEF